jgi:hypothetical protein
MQAVTLLANIGTHVPDYSVRTEVTTVKISKLISGSGND